MPEFAYTDLLPMGEDTTPYRLVTAEGVSTFEADGRTFLKVEPEALRRTITLESSLAAAQEALERAEDAQDRADRSLANRDFHRALYLPCGNPLLARMLDEVTAMTAA